jgi:hypothetical protein
MRDMAELFDSDIGQLIVIFQTIISKGVYEKLTN